MGVWIKIVVQKMQNLNPVETLREKYSGKNVLVLGIGVLGGGVGSARFFADIGAKVVATDLKSAEQLDPSLLRQLQDLGVELKLGGHSKEMIDAADLVIRNPAVPLDSEYVQYAKEQNIPVVMDAALFVTLSPAPIIGVTGTRGKTTTCNMIASILQAVGKHVLLGGNIHGTSTLDLLYEVNEKSIVVLELSSWALQGFCDFAVSPHIAVITNIYPDHLNRYTDMQSYVDDKQTIFAYQKPNDILFLNSEDGFTSKFSKKVVGKVGLFNKKDLLQKIELQLPGEHNMANAACAFGVARYLGVSEKDILSSLSQFSGVPYRLEIIAEINGVTYVNDTTSTTPTSVIAALNAFMNKSIVLIIGGADKNLPLDELVKLFQSEKQVKDVVFLKGGGTSKLLEALGRQDAVVYDNLEKAVFAASNKANKGDYVIFSPGFTSFEMFKNEFDRGDRFNQIVNSLNAKN